MDPTWIIENFIAEIKTFRVDQFLEHPKLLKMLLTHDSIDLELSPISELSQQGFGHLHMAISGGENESLKVLVDYFDLDKKTKNGWTPLHMAAFKGDREAVDILVNHGAIVNARTNDNETPRELAQQRGIEIGELRQQPFQSRKYGSAKLKVSDFNKELLMTKNKFGENVITRIMKLLKLYTGVEVKKIKDVKDVKDVNEDRPEYF